MASTLCSNPHVAMVAMAALFPLVPAILLKSSEISDGNTSDSHCDCLNWKEVYGSKRVFCGEFLELGDFTHGKEDLNLLGISHQWRIRKEGMKGHCTEFLEKLNSSRCFPIQGNEQLKEGKSWCYVSNKCEDLRGGREIADKVFGGAITLKRDVAARVCEKTQPQLDRIAPEELFELAKHSNMSFVDGVLALYEWGEWLKPWTANDGAWNSGNISALSQMLQRRIFEDSTFYYPNTNDMHRDGVILRYNQLWDVYLSPKRCPKTKYCLEKRKPDMYIPPDYVPPGTSGVGKFFKNKIDKAFDQVADTVSDAMAFQ
mmetsp:Transcript_57673/g.168879  ORF Transcript_57673/g.168879 Transcript_57673/m.168879 type:complete len:315 (+) Transcript_57673:42-986(+)